MRLMAVGLPLLGLAALLVCLMTWLIVRRTTADAQALDSSHTSLQDSQNALATSEARFRDVVEASSDWVWEIDGEWRFTYLSERFESVTGLDRQAWIGATLYDLLDTDAGALSQWLTTPGRLADISLQCRYVDARGRERTTRLSAREMPCGGFRGTATDVTEEVEARRRIEFLSSTTPSPGCPIARACKRFWTVNSKPCPPSPTLWSCSAWTWIGSNRSMTCSGMPPATGCSMRYRAASLIACATVTWSLGSAAMNLY